MDRAEHRHNGCVPAIAPFGSPEAAAASVETRIIDPAAPTLLAFAGMGHGLQMPIAEFAGVLAPLAVNVLFVKDLAQCWYQHGIRGLGPSPAAAAAALRDVLPGGSSLAGTVGTSSGATAAILFGVLLEAPTMLAFSPRTLIDADAVIRWREAIPGLPDIDLDAPTADLRQILQAHAHGRVVVQYGAENANDAAQVDRIRALPGVEVVALPTDWHPSAAWLRDAGRLGPTLAETFALTLRPGHRFTDARDAAPTLSPARRLRVRLGHWLGR